MPKKTKPTNTDGATLKEYRVAVPAHIYVTIIDREDARDVSIKKQALEACGEFDTTELRSEPSTLNAVLYPEITTIKNVSIEDITTHIPGDDRD